MTEVERITDPNRILFPNLNIDVTINSTAFTIFGLEIQWYGLIITFGLLLAMLFCFPRMKKFGIDPDRAIDAVIGGIVGGIIGARLYYVLLKWEDYAGDIKAILNFRNGGLAIYGGIIGAILLGGLICKIRKVKLTPMLDIASIGFLIGQGIGRWGNFVNQEAFGTNTDSLFAMTGGTIQNTIINQTTYMDGAMYELGVSESFGVHPCFLYESVWCLLGFAILAFWIKRRKFDGQIFLMYLTWYGAGRAVIEGLRTDSLMAGYMRASQVLAIILAVCSLLLHIIVLAKIKRCNGEGFELYVDTEESKMLIAQSEEKYAKKDKKSQTDITSDSDDNNILASDDEVKTDTDGTQNDSEIATKEDNNNGSVN